MEEGAGEHCSDLWPRRFMSLPHATHPSHASIHTEEMKTPKTASHPRAVRREGCFGALGPMLRRPVGGDSALSVTHILGFHPLDLVTPFGESVLQE